MARRNSKRKGYSKPSRSESEMVKGNNNKNTTLPSNGESKSTSGSPTSDKKPGEGKIGSNADIDNGARSADPANDPSWYANYPELAMAAGNLPFAESFGSQIKLGTALQVETADNNKLAYEPLSAKAGSVAGICTLVTKPSYGTNFDRNDPLNIAAQQFFTNVRHANSGRKNYDAPDLMMYLLTVSDILSYIAWCQRLYCKAFAYSQRNFYIGKALIEAERVSADSIIKRLADFRYYINAMLAKVSGWVIPGDINIFKRRVYMFGSIYTESTTGNIKDQLYQYAPDGFYQFGLNPDSGFGKMFYKQLPTLAGYDDAPDDYRLTLDDIMKIGDSLIEVVYGDEDFALISGDISKAYGPNVLSMNPIPEAAIIIPVYEEYTLSQMRNANIAPVYRGKDAPIVTKGTDKFKLGDIEQNGDGNLVTLEALNIDATASAAKMLPAITSGIITVTNPNPGLDDVLEATRLMTVDANNVRTDEFLSQVPGAKFIATGSDIVVAERISRYEWVNNVWTLKHYHLTDQVFTWDEDETDPAVKVTELFHEYELSLIDGAFHWTPLRYTVVYKSNGSFEVVSETAILSNIDNYTTLSDINVRHLHECCLLSLLSVPGVVKLVG